MICSVSSAADIPLISCGKIIAHENGLFDFNPAKVCNPGLGLNHNCPNQITAMLNYNKSQGEDPNKTIRFTKMSLRTLKDGSWVVSHDDNVTFTDKSGKQITVALSLIDSNQFNQYREDLKFPVFRLEDYVSKDTTGALCFMLNTKTPPNSQLLSEMIADGISSRSMIEVSDNDQARWINAQVIGTPIYFSTRVSTQQELDQVLSDVAQYGYKNMYFIEVDPNNETAQLVNAIKTKGYLTELDSMTYDKLKEWNDSACDTPLNQFKSGVTMTSRPVECINKHHHDNTPPQ
jgi:glycerophosphoryl diester phosphodiesterase